MSGHAPYLVCSWRVGARTCTLSIPKPTAGKAVHAVCEWEPDQPKRLTKQEQQQYVQGRDEALRGLFAGLQLNAVVVDL